MEERYALRNEPPQLVANGYSFIPGRCYIYDNLLQRPCTEEEHQELAKTSKDRAEQSRLSMKDSPNRYCVLDRIVEDKEDMFAYKSFKFDLYEERFLITEEELNALGYKTPKGFSYL